MDYRFSIEKIAMAHILQINRLIYIYIHQVFLLNSTYNNSFSCTFPVWWLHILSTSHWIQDLHNGRVWLRWSTKRDIPIWSGKGKTNHVSLQERYIPTSLLDVVHEVSLDFLFNIQWITKCLNQPFTKYRWISSAFAGNREQFFCFRYFKMYHKMIFNHS